MREIQILVTCDKCGDTFGEDDATNFEIDCKDGVIVEIDICINCQDGFLEGARAKPKKKQRPGGSKPGGFKLDAPDREDAVCPECGNTYTTQRGLSSHMTRQGHGPTTEEE